MINLENIRTELNRLHSLSAPSASNLLLEIQTLTSLLDRLAGGNPIEWRGRWIVAKEEP